MTGLAGSLLVLAVTAAASRPATPTAFPAPGTYGGAIQITLATATRGAQIHYTLDGTEPTAASPVFDPSRLIALGASREGNRGLRREYTIFAVALVGQAASGPARFTYVIARRDHDAYVSRELHPGVFMIADDETDKLFLVRGARRALLIDTGMGGGDLRGYVESLAGGLPLDVVITHAHPDHLALVDQFQRDHDVYMCRLDLPLLERFAPMIGKDLDPGRIRDVGDGQVFDLGERRLTALRVPGHTPGSLVLMDEASGVVFSGDAVGSNRAAVPDALWLQMEGMPPIDVYLSTLRAFRARVHGRVKEIYTGHNDGALLGETYLDNLQRAAQRLVDQGPEALAPSLRPAGAWWVAQGDRLADPNWAAVNVNRETCLSAAPGAIATLSRVELAPGALVEASLPQVQRVVAAVDAQAKQVAITVTPTSSRCRGMTIDGVDVRPGRPHDVRLRPGENVVSIVVTSPDGTASRSYELVVMRR